MTSVKVFGKRGFGKSDYKLFNKAYKVWLKQEGKKIYAYMGCCNY